MNNDLDREYEGSWRSRPRRVSSTGTNYWLQRGWLSFEASAFKYITHEAIADSPYLQKMIDDRVARFKRAQRDRLTNREYYFRVRQKFYVDAGYTNNIRLLKNNIQGRNIAFILFNAYKSKYGVVDTTTGKIIGTPRPKTKIVVKKGTSNDRAIAAAQQQIHQLQDKLKFERNQEQRNDLLRRINIQQNRINELGG